MIQFASSPHYRSLFRVHSTEVRRQQNKYLNQNIIGKNIVVFSKSPEISEFYHFPINYILSSL